MRENVVKQASEPERFHALPSPRLGEVGPFAEWAQVSSATHASVRRTTPLLWLLVPSVSETLVSSTTHAIERNLTQTFQTKAVRIYTTALEGHHYYVIQSVWNISGLAWNLEPLVDLNTTAAYEPPHIEPETIEEQIRAPSSSLKKPKQRKWLLHERDSLAIDIRLVGLNPRGPSTPKSEPNVDFDSEDGELLPEGTNEQ